MKLTLLGNDNCANGRTCPRIYLTDRSTLLVQGYDVDDRDALAVVNAPAGESVVEIPIALLKEVADQC
jgi:hypothetical protein